MSSPSPNISELFAAFRPDADRLLGLLSQQVNDRMLRQIAESDWGKESDEHFAALKNIRDTGAIPCPLEWHPREVLELCCSGNIELTRMYAEPESLEQLQPGTQRDEHLIRAFCCAVLLKAWAEPQSAQYLLSGNYTLIFLIASLLTLGPDLVEAAEQFLAWLTPLIPDDELERPFYGLALVMLSLALPATAGRDAQLVKVCDWLTAEEERVRSEYSDEVEDETWLLGLTDYNQKHRMWRSAVHGLLLHPGLRERTELQTRLSAIANRIRQPEGEYIILTGWFRRLLEFNLTFRRQAR